MRNQWKKPTFLTTAVRQLPAWRYVSAATRLALVGVIVWMGIPACQSIAKLMGRRPQPLQVRTVDHATDGESDALAIAMLPTAGFWTVADSQWGLGQAEFGEKDVMERLAAISAQATDAPPKSESASPPSKPQELIVAEEEWTELIDLAQQMEPLKAGDNRIYSIERADLKARLVFHKSAAGEDLIAGALAFPVSNGRWSYIDLADRSPADPRNSATHLLPLPADARRDMARWSSDHRLQMEVISLHSDALALAKLWTDAGWRVRHSNMGDPLGFSLLCVRDKQTIYVWSDEPAESITRMMLVDASNPENQLSRDKKSNGLRARSFVGESS